MVDVIQKICIGAPVSTTGSQAENIAPRTRLLQNLVTDDSGINGGHPDLVAWDLIEQLNEVLG